MAFFLSTSVHLSLCLVLAVTIISGQGPIGNSFQLAIAPSAESEMVTELNLTLDETFSIPEESMSVSLDSSVISVDTSKALNPTSSPDELGAYSRNIANLTAGAQRSFGAAVAVPSVAKSRATFFGAQAEGNRFVFVIDSSGSMRGPRWEALCKELIRAIKSLSPDQDFFVISFDSQAHPMFGKAPPVGKFLNAVEKNVDRVQNWIRSIKHGSQTYPASAVSIAMKLNPDAIFLLSDGEISDSTIEDLRVYNKKQTEDGLKTITPIHTVLLHSQIGFVALETIARENSGTFTPVTPR